MLLAAWFVYMLAAPTWGFFWIDAWHNEQRAAQVVLLCVTAMFAVAIPALRKEFVLRSVTGALIGAFAALGAVSAVRAGFARDAFADVALALSLLILGTITAAAIRAAPGAGMAWAQRACLLLGIVHVTGVAARYAAMVALEKAPGIDVLLLGYANPRFPSALYALLVPMIAAAALDATHRPALRRTALVVLPLLWCVNLALGTRAVWFAYLGAFPIVVLIAGWPRTAALARLLAVTAVIGALLYYALFIVLPAALHLGDAMPSQIQHLTSFADRLNLWKQAAAVIAAHPLLGIGPMNLAALGDSYASHPHNWPLQVAAEWGLPAFAVLGAILWRATRATRVFMRSGSERDVTPAMGPLTAVCVGLVYGLVDGNLIMPVSQTAFVLVAGLLAGAVSTLRPLSDQARPTAYWATILPLCASALYLGWYAAATLSRQDDVEATWRKTSKYQDLAPRFWQQGLLR